MMHCIAEYWETLMKQLVDQQSYIKIPLMNLVDPVEGTSLTTLVNRLL